MSKHINLTKGNRRTVILMMALAIMACSRLTLDAQNETVTGVIKNASGQAVAGALVKVGSVDLGITFMVVSQAQGRYSTPHLLPGEYTVQGFGGGYKSEPAGPVAVRSGQAGKMDVVLSTPQRITPPEKRMTNADYSKLMPEGEGKRLLISRCALCHDLDRPVGKRGTREEWGKTVDRMLSFLEERSDLGGPLSEQQREVILDYVAKHFGPDTPRLRGEEGPSDPSKHFPRTLLQGTEAKYVAMELELPSRRNEYEIAVDSEGMAWISERETSMFGRFDPKTLTYTRIAAPPALGKVPRLLAQIAVDPRDQVWVLDNSSAPNAELLEYNPKTKEFKTYEIPAPPRFGSAPLNTLRFLDGNVWGPGNVSSRIVKLDPSTRKITEYHVPGGSHPYGIAIGADNMIWYTAMYSNEVVRLDPNSGQLTPYKVPTPRSGLRRMGADAEGNLWAAAHDSGKLVKVDARTGKIIEYDVPTEDPGPYSVDVDTRRNLVWFSRGDADKVGRFDPRTNSFVEFPLPSAGTASRRILVDSSNRNRIWWGGSRIGYIEVIE